MYPLNQPYLSFPVFFTTAVSAGADIPGGPYEVPSSRSMLVQINSIPTGSISAQGSVDGVNYNSLPMTRFDSITSGNTATAWGQIGSYCVNTFNNRYIKFISGTAISAGAGVDFVITFSDTIVFPALTLSVPSVNATSGAKNQTLVTTNVAVATTGGAAANYSPTPGTLGLNFIALKNAQGTITSLNVSNSAIADAYLKVANTAAIALGTDKAVINLLIKAGTTVSYNAGYAGAQFGSGIALWVAGGSSLIDITAPPAGVLVNVGWI